MELLSGTAHLKRGGRNPTDGVKNRARSLTKARYALLCQFHLHPIVAWRCFLPVFLCFAAGFMGEVLHMRDFICNFVEILSKLDY